MYFKSKRAAPGPLSPWPASTPQPQSPILSRPQSPIIPRPPSPPPRHGPLSPSIISRPQSPIILQPPSPPARKPTQMMAPTTEGKLFRGDYSAGEKPHIWFRRLESKFDDETSLATKLYQFSKNLEPGRPAEVWFHALAEHQKENWNYFYSEFTERWPLPTIVEPSREELLQKLDQTRLTKEEVGTTIERDGDRVYTHVAWAEEVKTLIDVLDDAEGYLIPQVRRNLPLIIRLILPTNLNNWSAFLAAVTSISMDRIADQQENTDAICNDILQMMGIMMGNKQPLAQQRNMATVTTGVAAANVNPVRHTGTSAYISKINTTTSMPSTPSTVRQTYTVTPTQPEQWNTVTRLPISTPTNQRFNQPINTPSGSFLSNNSESTLHTNSNQKTPIPQKPTPNRTQLTNQDLARKAIAVSSTFPDTPEGKANYQTALQAWEAVYPPAREVDFTTAPYPLTPGTAPLGSRECYRCGIPGHITRDHDPVIPAINIREQHWRALVSRSLQTRARMDFSSISQTNTQDEEPMLYGPAIYNIAQLDFPEEYEK